VARQIARSLPAGVLGDGDEFGRRHQFAAAPPAHEGLEAGDSGVAQIDPRLIVDLELATLHRAVQVALHLDACPAATVGPGLAPDEVVAPACLGEPVGPIGARNQELRPIGVHGESRQTGRGRQKAVDVLDTARVAQLGQNRPHQGLGGVALPNAGEHQCELVAGKARNAQPDVERWPDARVPVQAAGHHGGHPSAGFGDQFVAGTLAQRLVEVRKPVEVEEDEMQLGSVALAATQLVGKAAQEIGPVGHAGEGIAGGQAFDLLTAALLVGLAAHLGAQHPHGAGCIELGASLGDQVAHFAGWGAQPELGPKRLHPPDRLGHGVEESQPVERIDLTPEFLLRELAAVGAQAKHVEAARRAVQHAGGDIVVEDP
jgi:hypothetical protein